MAKQRCYEIVHEYSDTISGVKAKRPGLDQLTVDARRRRFDACCSLRQGCQKRASCLGGLRRVELPCGIEFVGFRENIDTGGPLGRAIVVIVGAIAELERNLIVERVKAGMRRAK